MATMKLLLWISLCGLLASAAVAGPPSLRLDVSHTARLVAMRADSIDALIVDDAQVWSLTPLDVYAPDAVLQQFDAAGHLALPRSTHRLFRLQDPSGAWLGVLVLDARGAWVAATVFGDSAIYRGENTDGSGATNIEFRDLADALPEGVVISSGCDFQQSMSPAILPSLAPPGTSARASIGAPTGALVQARLAIDTDNELLNLKFGNNTTAANNYVVQLVALMTVIYERDLGVRLLIGTAILRTTPDPYAVDGTNALAQLNEFGEFWRVNQGGVARAFALQLSGKSQFPNSASGIAWLLPSGNFCASTGQVFGSDTAGHFSVTQVFRFAGATAANDVALVAHELGHNFGANHTHCTDVVPGPPLQPIDMCFTGESADPNVCYTGALSCPAETGGQGTLMSYCNRAGPIGANCGLNVRQEFHPVHITQLSGRVLTNTQNGCFTPAAQNNTIFANGFE